MTAVLSVIPLKLLWTKQKSKLPKPNLVNLKDSNNHVRFFKKFFENSYALGMDYKDALHPNIDAIKPKQPICKIPKEKRTKEVKQDYSVGPG